MAKLAMVHASLSTAPLVKFMELRFFLAKRMP